ncbi:MFS transporter, partial [Mycobacterium tuberculosis]|nr:MFS transporter [Mycobacterium tuberculosis]
PWIALARRRPHPDPLDTAADPAAQPHGKVWRSPLAWGMALMFGMTSLMTYSMFTWLPRIVVEAGATPRFGGIMVAIFAALGLLPSLTMPALA